MPRGPKRSPALLTQGTLVKMRGEFHDPWTGKKLQTYGRVTSVGLDDLEVEAFDSHVGSRVISKERYKHTDWEPL